MPPQLGTAEIAPDVNPIERSGLRLPLPPSIGRIACAGLVALSILPTLAGCANAAANPKPTPTPNQAPGTTLIYPAGMMQAHAVLMSNGCSGFEIDDPKTDQPEAVITASHCGMRNGEKQTSTATPWIKGEDGQWYIVQNPVTATRRAANGEMHTVGTITEWVLPAPGFHGSDIAIGLFPGVAPDKGMHDVQQNMANWQEMQALVPGQTIVYSGAFPGTDDKGQIYEEFNMVYAGMASNIGSSDTDIVETTIITGVKKQPDGTVCQPGSSGSAAFIKTRDGRYVILGAQSFYMSLKNDHDRAWFKQNFPNVDWDTMDAACYYSPLLPTTNVTPVPSMHSIPGTEANFVEQKQVDYTNALQLFFDPEHQTTIAYGTAVIELKPGSVKGVEVPTTLVIKNPILFMNPDGTYMIAFDSGGGLAILSSRELSNITYYALNDHSLLELKHAHLDANATIGPDGYRDMGGNVFGQLLSNTSAPVGQTAYCIAMDNGQPMFIGLKP